MSKVNKVAFVFLMTTALLILPLGYGQEESAQINKEFKRNYLARIAVRQDHRKSVRGMVDGQVHTAVDRLSEAWTYEQLQRLPKYWEKHLPRMAATRLMNWHNDLIRLLLRKMSSRKKLPLKLPPHVFVHPYDKPVGERDPNRKSWLWVKHDLFMEGGRCAWAIEQILHVDLLSISNQMTDEQLEFAVRENIFIVFQEMAVPDSFYFDSMTPDQRLEFAKKTLNKRLLLQMAKDGDGDKHIRMAIASRIDMDEEVLYWLRGDKDKQVAQTAQKSGSQKAIVLFDDPVLPDPFLKDYPNPFKKKK